MSFKNKCCKDNPHICFNCYVEACKEVKTEAVKRCIEILEENKYKTEIEHYENGSIKECWDIGIEAIDQIRNEFGIEEGENE